MKSRKSIREKVIASFLAASMVCTMMPAASLAAGETEDLPLLAEFTFDDTATGFRGGQAQAALVGSPAVQETDGRNALYLDGSSDNFLTVTDAEGNSLLSGATELTISYEAKPDQSSTTNWVFYAAPNGNQQVYNRETYIGILEAGGSTKVERYNNNGSRPANPSAATGTDWVHVDVVLSRFETSIYVNGVKQAEQNSGYRIETILGSNSIVQIGKANWTGSSAGVSMGQAIDPSIFTDDDGTSYILFGNGSAAIAELNDDMMSIKEGSIRQINGLTDFRESVVVTKVDGKYHWNSPNYHVNYGVTDTLWHTTDSIHRSAYLHLQTDWAYTERPVLMKLRLMKTDICRSHRRWKA